MITVIGSLNMDLVTKAPKMPVTGETILGIDFKQHPGGKGANQAAAIARLGSNISMVGRIGDDKFGETLMQSLKADGVDVSQIRETQGVSTGIAAITVSSKGENSIIVVPGANYMLSCNDIDEADQALKESKIVVAQLEVPTETVKYAFSRAKGHGVFTILNPAPAIQLDDDFLSLVDLITPNETEIETIIGRSLNSIEDIKSAAAEIIEKGVKEVIVTLGAKGCLYVSRDKSAKYPAIDVNVVDTTAAGDSFTGGIAVKLSEGATIDEAIKFAIKVSSLTVTKAGAQESLPTREEVDNFTEFSYV